MNSYTDQDNVTEERSEYWKAHYIYGDAYHVVTTLQITLTMNVLIEEYWPSPIFTNTWIWLCPLAMWYWFRKFYLLNAIQIYRWIPLRKSTFTF